MARRSQKRETNWTHHAKARSLPTLMSFFSVSPDHGLALDQPPPEKWFSANDGLGTINGLLDEAENHKLDARVVADLREFRSVLEKAKQNGVGWHLAVDF